MSRKSNKQEQLDELKGQYKPGGISRRAFIQRAAILGLSLPAASSFLASASKAFAQEATPEPIRGGVFTEGYDRDVTKMDPVFSGWADPGYNALYEYTMIRDFDGQPVPMIAESWDVSEDGLVWTLKIRDGLTFHSGTPLTNASVVEDFNIFRDPAVGQNAVFWEPVDTIEAGDNNTVILTMKHPFAALPETLATEYSMIHNDAVRRENIEAFGASVADGSGPFTLTNFAPGDETLVSRWEEYPGSIVPFVENKGTAYVDQVRWVPIIEPSNRATELEVGGVDAVKNPTPQDTMRLETNPDVVVIEFPSPANFFIALNQARTNLGFDDLRVRQAISHAIDRQAIASNLFFGKAAGTQGPIANNWKWYEPGVEAFNGYDTAAAAALLDDAGWTVGSDGIREKDGQKLSFAVIVNSDYSRDILTAEAVSGMLSEIGVEMTVQRIDSGEFINARAEADAYGLEWLWSAQADVLIFFFIFPSLEYTGGDQALLDIFATYQSAANDEELEAAARQIQLLWAEKLPTIPIVSPYSIWAHSTRVHGWRPNPAMLYPLYNDVWVEQ